MQQILALWAALDTTRRVLAIGVSIAMFAAITMVAKIASSPGMALLYAGLEDAAAGEVIQSLEARGIAYSVRGDAIFVPANQRDETRLMLASVGLPANSHTGYELLDSLSGFGTTSQMFDAAYWRAKEGELARTIVASPHIRSARVHISQGSTSPFRREIAPTASVTVTSAGGPLTHPQALSLRYLVASAVAGMTPEDVSIIDGVGGLVYGPDSDPTAGSKSTERAQELRRNVERLLEAHVGHGRAVVELSLETVTDRELIIERNIDPESRTAMSTETEESNAISNDTRGAAVTVASNLPDGDAAAGDGQSETRDTTTRQRTNYEISETRREIERNPGAIRRMTVAVLVDGIRVPDEDGQMVWQERPAAELEALRELVASASGFDEARGDVITLRSLPFEPISALGTEASSGLFSPANLDIMSLLKWAFVLLSILVMALFVLRPILKAASAGKATAYLDPPSGGSVAALAGPDVQPVSEYQGQENEIASEDPVERLRRMIAEREDDSVQVLRHWMDERREQT